MMSGHGTVETAVEATRLGAFDYVEKPLSLAKLLRTVERAMDAGKRRRVAGRPQLTPLPATFGKSRVAQQLREELTRVAALNASLLLVGEPGSGREALARFTHEIRPARQPRLRQRWSPAPCPRMPRRATCSAASAAGRDAGPAGPGAGRHAVHPGSGGSLAARAAPAAGRDRNRPLPSRRAPTATPASPSTRASSPPRSPAWSSAPATTAGLRRDLFAHLSGVLVRVPPLRDYAEDVPDLLRFYVERIADAEKLPLRRFSVAAQNRLRNYPWPGNLRELRSLVRRMLARGGPKKSRSRRSSTSSPRTRRRTSRW